MKAEVTGWGNECAAAAEAIGDLKIYELILDDVIEGHITAKNDWHAMAKVRKYFGAHSAKVVRAARGLMVVGAVERPEAL